MLVSPTAIQMSDVARSHALGVDRKTFWGDMHALASSALHAAAHRLWQWQTCIDRGFRRAQRVLFVEAMRYDGTPMTVRTCGASSSARAATALTQPSRQADRGVVARRAEQSSSVVGWTPVQGERTTTKAAATKILQSEALSAALLEHEGQFIALVGQSICHLQVLERTTARCLQEALLRQSTASPIANTFQSTVRLATTDKASSNIACERSYIQHTRHDGWTNIHHSCDVHTVARIFGRVFAFCNSDITGMIQATLSLNVAGAMNNFRLAMREEILARGITLHVGTPPVAATRHRSRVLSCFASSEHGSSSVSPATLALLLPNGDWRRLEITLYISEASRLQQPIDEIANVVCNGIISALAATNIATYPRHRWTGADVCVDRFGLLQSVHQLGAATYARYLSMFHSALAAPPGGPDAGVVPCGDK